MPARYRASGWRRLASFDILGGHTRMSEIDPESEAPGPKDAAPAASDPPTRTQTIFPSEGAVREESELPAGAVLGPFRIVTLLGRGGMGVVYEAEDVDSGRRVALKVLSPGLRREIDHARFLKEGRLAAGMRLLRESSLSIADVATTVGFTDQSYFDKRFKRAFGSTPRDFRAGK